jgi:hypothetical protein
MALAAAPWAAAFALLLLAAACPAAAEETATMKGLLNRPALFKLSMQNLFKSQYLELIIARYAMMLENKLDILEMLRAQQRWRRRATKDGAEELGDLLDCRPTFNVSRTKSGWLRTRTISAGLCFTVCADFPFCTSTAPLVIDSEGAPAPPTPSDLSVLLWCGVQAKSGDTKELVELRTPGAGDNGTAVCRNTVDRSRDLPGVTVSTVTVPPAANTARFNELKVEAFGRTAAPHEDQLTLYTHDLWSHWRWPVIEARGVRTRSERTRAIITPHLGRIGDEPASVNQFMLHDIWTLMPNKNGLDAAYAMWREDLGGRWYAMPTYGRQTSTWTGYANVNGPCEQVETDMWALADAWRNLSVATHEQAPTCEYLDTPNIARVDQVGGGWFNAGTRVFDRTQRMDGNNHCPIILGKKEGIDGYVRACDDAQTAIFQYNSWGGGCLGTHFSMHPSIESLLGVGVDAPTYSTAWDYFLSKVRDAAEPGQLNPFLIDGRNRSTRAGDYYTLLNASLQFDTADLWSRMLKALARTEERVHDLDMDKNLSTLVIAFSAWLITLMCIPQHFNDEMRLRVMQLCKRHCRIRNNTMLIALVAVARVVASAIIVGPALVSFLVVLGQESGARIDDGFPTVSYERVNHPACNDARIGQQAIGVIETQTVHTTVDTSAVVAICIVSLAAMSLATWISVSKTRDLLRKKQAGAGV